MTNHEPASETDTSWIERALVPRWLLFRHSFVRKTGLTPVVVHGRATENAGPRGFDVTKLFPTSAVWAPIDIEDLAPPPPNPLQLVDHNEVEALWGELECLNAVVWWPNDEIYAAFAGTDVLCLLGQQSRIEEAFDCVLQSLDEVVRRRARETLQQLESRRANAFDDVWLRNFVWLQSFRPGL